MTSRHHGFFVFTLCIVSLLLLNNSFPAQAQATPIWPMWGHDQFHTNRSPANGPNSADVAWTYQDPAGGTFGDVIVAADGTIYATLYYSALSSSLLAKEQHRQQSLLRPRKLELW